MNTVKLLMSMLKSAIENKDIENDFRNYLCAETYSQLYSLAKAHELVPIVASVLSQMGLLGDDEISRSFHKKLLTSVYSCERRNYVLEQVSSSFEEAEIQYIPLKGAVLCHYYPENWMRTSCDIDILIHKSDSEKAIKKLCDLGYQLQKSTSIHDYSLFSPTNVHLELHYTLAQEECLEVANSVLDRVWEYTVPAGKDTYRRTMSNEMFLLYHIAHMAKHFLGGGCGIRPFLDFWIIKNRMPVETRKLEKILSKADLMVFYKSVCALISVWFENRSHSTITEQMESFILTGGVYGSMDNAALIKSATGESKFKYFMQLMILSRDSLKILYPNLEKYPVLFPYYQVARWFGIFSKKRRNRLKRMTQIRNSVSQDQTKDAIVFLSKLGLV